MFGRAFFLTILSVLSLTGSAELWMRLTSSTAEAFYEPSLALPAVPGESTLLGDIGDALRRTERDYRRASLAAPNALSRSSCSSVRSSKPYTSTGREHQAAGSSRRLRATQAAAE